MRIKIFKLIILNCLILFSINIYSQELPIHKRTLLKQFRKSKKDFQLEDKWLICNKDSSFYKNDTLLVYNHTNFFYHSNCCEFIEWDFFRNKKFDQCKTWICEEPPQSTISKRENACKVSVKKKGEILSLITTSKRYSQEYKITEMEIVELWKNGHKSFRMKLIKK